MSDLMPAQPNSQEEAEREAEKIADDCSKMHDSDYPFYTEDEDGACQKCIATALSKRDAERKEYGEKCQQWANAARQELARYRLEVASLTDQVDAQQEKIANLIFDSEGTPDRRRLERDTLLSENEEEIRLLHNEVVEKNRHISALRETLRIAAGFLEASINYPSDWRTMPEHLRPVGIIKKCYDLLALDAAHSREGRDA